MQKSQQKGNIFELHQIQFQLVLSCKCKFTWSFRLLCWTELGYRCSSVSAMSGTWALTAYQRDSCVPSGCGETWYCSPASLRCCLSFIDVVFFRSIYQIYVLLMCGRGVSLISVRIFLCQTAKSIPQSMLICFSRTWRLNLNFFLMLWKINLFKVKK